MSAHQREEEWQEGESKLMVVMTTPGYRIRQGEQKET